MSNRLEKKIALVTGAGTGIGEAIAKRFAEEGALVYASDLNGESANRVAAEIVAAGGRAEGRTQDVTDEALWAGVIADIVAEQGRLDVLVNNAGIVIPNSFEDATLDEWRTTQAVNGESVFMGTRAGVTAMQEHGGSIINISSIEGIIGEPRTAAYNYSKGGVRIFTKSAALACAEKGYPIRVNSVHPGLIHTALVEGAMAALPEDEAEEFMTRITGGIPLGSLGEPLDIANGCLYLACDESKYVTGAELVIDGGFTAH